MIALIHFAALAASAGAMPAATTSQHRPVAIAAAAQALPMVGGYRAVDVGDEAVQHIAAFVSEEMQTEFVEIASAHRQTVQGANYRLVLVDGEGNRWQVVVYQNLQGELQVTSSEQI